MRLDSWSCRGLHEGCPDCGCGCGPMDTHRRVRAECGILHIAWLALNAEYHAYVMWHSHVQARLPNYGLSFSLSLSLPVTLASPLWQLSALVASLLAHLTLTLAHQNPFGNLQPGLPSCLWLPAPAPVPGSASFIPPPLPAVWLRLAQSTRSICIFYCVLIN